MILLRKSITVREDLLNDIEQYFEKTNQYSKFNFSEYVHQALQQKIKTDKSEAKKIK